MRKIQVGIIGCGAIAEEKHLPGLTAIDYVDVVGFFDMRKDSAERMRQQFGAPGAEVCTDVEALIQAPDIDVIHICTPSQSHADLSIRALRAGKHVMCEKPMAATVKEAEEMLRVSKEAGKKLTIGCQNRFRQDVRYLKSVCERGDLGEIYYARALALRRRAVPTWLLIDEQEQGGGPLLDIGTHALDLTMYLMDNFAPKYVVGKTFGKLNRRANESNIWESWNPDKFLIPESAFGFIEMQNGAVISLETSWALNILQPGEARTCLCGTGGGADMHDGLRINGTEFGGFYEKRVSFDKILNLGLNEVDFTTRGHYEDAGILEAKSWIDSVANNKEPVVKPDQTLMVLKILDAVNESTQTGEPVYFR